MEVNRSKQLHRHSVPIVLIVSAGFIVSFFAVQAYQLASPTYDFKRALTTSLISIHGSPHGLANIAIIPPEPIPLDQPIANNSELVNIQNNVGATTALGINLQNNTSTSH